MHHREINHFFEKFGTKVVEHTYYRVLCTGTLHFLANLAKISQLIQMTSKHFLSQINLANNNIFPEKSSSITMRRRTFIAVNSFTFCAKSQRFEFKIIRIQKLKFQNVRHSKR